MNTWLNRAPPATWQGPEDKRQTDRANSPKRLTHRNPDTPAEANYYRQLAGQPGSGS